MRKRKNSSSSSSSSSEDEMLEQLKECVEGFEHQKKDVQKEELKRVQKLSSKRAEVWLNEDEEEGESSHVTPEFQEFVGKKLKAKLDDLIDWVDFESETKHKKRKKRKGDKSSEDGFLIMSRVKYSTEVKPVESTKIIDQSENVKKKSKKHKKQKGSESSSSEDDEMMKMISEAAVEPNAVLATSCISGHKNLIDSKLNKVS